MRNTGCNRNENENSHKQFPHTSTDLNIEIWDVKLSVSLYKDCSNYLNFLYKNEKPEKKNTFASQRSTKLRYLACAIVLYKDCYSFSSNEHPARQVVCFL